MLPMFLCPDPSLIKRCTENPRFFMSKTDLHIALDNSTELSVEICITDWKIDIYISIQD